MWLKEAIDAARAEYDFALWAFVFMPEHVHLLLWPRQPAYDIAAIRQAIKEPVGRQAMNYVARNAPDWLPRLTRTRGKKTERLFWQCGGGFDRNIWTTQTWLAAIEYIHLNPVRRGLVRKATDWKWSSAAWYELHAPVCGLGHRLALPPATRHLSPVCGLGHRCALPPATRPHARGSLRAR